MRLEDEDCLGSFPVVSPRGSGDHRRYDSRSADGSDAGVTAANPHHHCFAAALYAGGDTSGASPATNVGRQVMVQDLRKRTC